MTHRYTLNFEQIDRTQVALAGGKGVHLGELSRIEGVRVPAGFCVTTEAFVRIMAKAPAIEERLDRLSSVKADDRDAIRGRSAEIRGSIEQVVIPDEVTSAITHAYTRLGEQRAYAVRSSATAEDLPTASFAGQHDTYLNVVSRAAILDHVKRCWASLFTERAVIYRLRNGVDHRRVRMAVVVQRMVFPKAAGILFTADPVTGNRKVASVDAGFGLGEGLVTGRVNADVYKVREGKIVSRAIAAKALAIEPSQTGGVEQRTIDAEQRGQPALTDAQVVRLAALGRKIEAHFGRPQDIEWCLADEDFHFVQSRPITTLFPIPEVTDVANHVYISVGHQQMMTDAMKPLGLSVWQLTTPRPMAEAGGRLFVDVTQALVKPATRAGLLEMAGRSDPLIGDALRSIVDRGFIPTLPDDGAPPVPPVAPGGGIETDPAIVTELVEQSRASIAALKDAIRTKSGSELLDFIEGDIQELRRILFDRRSHQVFMTAMEAAWWINDHVEEWLGEKNASDVLTRSVPNNVTSEMGMALLDVADAIRSHPELAAFLQRVEDEGLCVQDFLDELRELPGGQGARDAILAWLEKYGMRGVGEIDITRPRWSERPAMLVPLILTHVKTSAPGDAQRRFEQGRQEAWDKERELLTRLRALPDGERKAEETKRRIDRVRTFIGYREYPKYGKVSREYVYKQALLKEAERLVEAGVLREKEDIFYLRFQELQEVVRAQKADEDLIRARKQDFELYESLTPPRVLTSEGEAVAGAYGREDLPAGALVGLAVSAGTVEGRARVVLDIADAEIEPGDILVTPFTDPSWTAVFVAIAGLVTEVGGLMTHGAVIAREYGLPAVVGVEHAATLIRDGQRIRVHGTEGYVEIL